MKKTHEEELKKFAEAIGVNFYVVQTKSRLVNKIKEECALRSISQRGLAQMVPGLTHDRVSKIFNGQISHMSVDKLVEILGELGISTEIRFKKVA